MDRSVSRALVAVEEVAAVEDRSESRVSVAVVAAGSGDNRHGDGHGRGADVPILCGRGVRFRFRGQEYICL